MVQSKIIRLISRFFAILLIVFLSSCDKGNPTYSYDVRFVAKSFEQTDNYHDIFLTSPVNINDWLKFRCKDTFDEVLGPYKSGTKVCFEVDYPNHNTYLVRLYIKEKRDKDFRLVIEEINNLDFILP